MSLTVESTARAMADAVRRREISARELLELHLARIAERNPQLNAIVSLDEERARAGAAAADAATARGDELGPLHGLPFAFKDTHDVAGWRTTYGSPLFADHVPDADDLVVERVRAAGAVPIGKTNVPEFAAGSHTFNTVFGTTLNPVDPTRSAGGSSGGAACALRAGHGAAGRRLRHGRLAAQPGVVLRRGRPAAEPGPGAVVADRQPVGDHRAPAARWPATSATWRCCCRSSPAPTRGCPPRSATRARRSPRRSAASSRGLRVALSPDLGGLLEVDPEVAGVVEQAGARFAAAGAHVVRGPPRPRRGRRHLPDPAGLALPGGLRRAAGRAPRRRSSRRSPTTSGPARR